MRFLLSSHGTVIWSPSSSLVDATTADRARKAGLRILPWTVNDRDELRRLLSIGIDGVISDRPDFILEQVRASP